MNKEIEKAMKYVGDIDFTMVNETSKTNYWLKVEDVKQFDIICQHITKQEEEIENKRKAFEHMQYISQEHLDKLDRIREVVDYELEPTTKTVQISKKQLLELIKQILEEK